MALEKMEAIDAAFVDGSITLFVAAGQEVDQDAVTEALKAYRMTVKGFKKPEAMPF